MIRRRLPFALLLLGTSSCSGCWNGKSETIGGTHVKNGTVDVSVSSFTPGWKSFGSGSRSGSSLQGDTPCGYVYVHLDATKSEPQGSQAELVASPDGCRLALNATPDRKEEWTVFHLEKTQPKGAMVPVAAVVRTEKRPPGPIDWSAR